MMPLGVTIVSPGYEELSAEAVKRFRAASGCEAVMVLDVPEGSGFGAKLHLDELCPARPIVFFDADWWALRTFEIEAVTVRGNGFAAVHDPATFGPDSWPAQDCVMTGMDPMSYVNTGFFGCDLSEQRTRDVFFLARKLAARADLIDPTDQGYLNQALKIERTDLRLLPTTFNFYQLSVEWGYFPMIPRGIIGLHAAGYKGADKLGALQLQAQVYGGDYRPMSADAMAAHHSATFDFR